MINSQEIVETITQLFAGSPSVDYEFGYALLQGMKIGFDLKKLDKAKPEIAKLLQVIGVDDYSTLIGLRNLTTLKNGEVWNKLETLDDWKALDLLVACADACGFIINEPKVICTNVAQLGDNANLISQYFYLPFSNEDGSINYDAWLKEIREKVVDNMFFVPAPKTIKSYASGKNGMDVLQEKHK